MSTPSPDSAVLDRHASLSGTVSGHDLVVLGSLDGDLRLSGRLHIAAGSRLRAKVQASVVELDGDFEGEVRTEILRVAASARAKGVFFAERISIQEGALLEGDVQAPALAAPPAAQAAETALPPADEPSEEPAEPEMLAATAAMA
ncbi:MAG TPA: polymer-forming cytoskeletal protein [Vicinamibacteria bacterium]|nr:polymer-forming cytoskeletal protein [Vicinamibacteria bacterium]